MPCETHVILVSGACFRGLESRSLTPIRWIAWIAWDCSGPLFVQQYHRFGPSTSPRSHRLADFVPGVQQSRRFGASKSPLSHRFATFVPGVQLSRRFGASKSPLSHRLAFFVLGVQQSRRFGAAPPAGAPAGHRASLSYIYKLPIVRFSGCYWYTSSEAVQYCLLQLMH